MFKHGRTGYTYYSVREKINYYKGVIAGRIDAPAETKRKAKGRLEELTRINEQPFATPTLVVTSDKHFGNDMPKPRLCVVVDEDDKDRVLVSPLYKRTTNVLVLDGALDRQVGEKKKWIGKSEIYETKYIENACVLTNNDKRKIVEILRKK